MPLTLKAIPPKDYGAYHVLINDPLISYNSGSIPHPVDQTFATKRLQDRVLSERTVGGTVQRGAYVDGVLVGDGSLFKNKKGELEIGYCVHTGHRRKGYASEMARQLVKLARDQGHKGPIAAGYAKDNPVSGKILEKLGFVCVGEEMNSSAGRTGLSAYWRMELPADTNTESIVDLRPLESADLGAVFALQHEKEGALLAGVEGDFVDEETFRTKMEADILAQTGKATIFALMADGKMAGYIGCFQGPSGIWQLSYWLAQVFWGRGIATAALAQLLKALPPAVLGQPIYAAVIDGNVASVRLLEKFGFIAYKKRAFRSAAHGAMQQQTLFRR